MRVLYLCVLLAATSLPAQAAIFRVGAGAGCTHSSLQAAIDAARVAPGPDVIRVTQSLTYADVALEIRDQDLTLEGGYASCASQQFDGFRHTRLDGSGGIAASVVTIRGFGWVTLRNLELRGGDDIGSGDRSGGGLDIIGHSHQILLEDVLIRNNRAWRGGGIAVRNDNPLSNLLEDVTLVIARDVRVEHNDAEDAGGAVHCTRAFVYMTGDRAQLARNSAVGSGGAVRAENCRVDIASSHLPASGSVLQANIALNGGAISASGDRTRVQMYALAPSSPIVLDANHAVGRGGAIEVRSGALVEGFDVVLSNNRAEAGGGAAYVADTNVSTVRNTARLRLSNSLTGAHPDAVNCMPALRCNRLTANRAQSANGAASPGAALLVFGDAVANVFKAPIATLEGTIVEAHFGETLMQIVPPRSGFAGARLSLLGALVHRNTALGALFDNPPRTDSAQAIPGMLQLWSSTIADNKTARSVVIRTVAETNGTSTGLRGLSLRNAIVQQPGARTIQVLAGMLNVGHVLHLLASDLSGIPLDPTHMLSDSAGFIDAANADYRLGPTSRALDYVFDDPNVPHHTPDRGVRPIDLPEVTNRDGPVDLGAYERQLE